MSGHVGNLSPQQAKALQKLRAAVADIPDKPEDDDYFYLRWLRARNFSLEKAEEMLRNHMKFRREIGADTILEDWTPPEVLRKCFPGGFFGEDRDGNPVWYDAMGNMDFKGLHRSAKKEDIIKLKVCHLETTIRHLQELSDRKGRHIERVTSILDMENLSYQRHYHWPAINLFREALTMFDENYPERTKRVLVVKAPRIFPVAYNLIKPFMREYTREKIVVLGTNWQEDLHKYISPDQLPQAYGGTRCEPDAWCTDYINPGCDVPPEYYLTNLTETSREEMERLLLGRGATHEIEYVVELSGTVLRWEFVSTDYDVGFGWYFKPSKGKPRRIKLKKEAVIPLKRRNSHVVPETGVYQCRTPGTYVLKFDNSYSWTRQKEVFYSVKVLPPDTELPLPAIPELDPTLSSDSEDEFFDCTEDPPPSPDQPVLQTGLTSNAEVDSEGATGTTLTSNAEVMEVEDRRREAPEEATGSSVPVLRTSISTTV